jgi:hypothetical protein
LGSFAYASSTAPSLILDHVVINEFEQNPPGDDTGREFVELFNPTPQAVDAGSWIIYTTHGDIESFTIPAGTQLPSRGFWYTLLPGQFIDNEEDSLVLLNALGQKVDETPRLSDTENDERSWQRYPDGSENWEFANPSTGGAVNVAEYPFPAILAALMIAVVLLIVRRKQIFDATGMLQ